MGTISNLKKIRIARNITQIELSAASKCSPAPISKLENGEVSSMAVSTVLRIAWALGVSAVDLVPGLAAPPSRAPRVLGTPLKRNFGVRE